MRKNIRLLSARTADILSSVRRTAMTLLVIMLTAMTAWADDVNLSEDPDITEGTAGHYYVNMPSGSGNVTNTLTINADDIAAGKGTFKVYDNGGKGGQYSTNCTGILVLTAPQNYVIQLSGDIYTETNWDKLTVYDNNEASGTTLLNEKSSSVKGVKTSIGTIISSANVMTIKFSSDGSGTYDGLDLTVTVVDPNADYAINGLSSATGGSISASVGGNNATTAKVADVVTLTATPDNTYVLSGISVTDASSNPVAVTWDGPFSNTATFTMPASVVTVTPTFSNNISVNMPKTDSKYVTIPSDVQSFKVYDDGGKDDKYSNNYEGTLVLTAPEGHKIRLSGSITLESYDKLTVYNGSKESGTKLLDAVSSSSSGTKTDITTFTSTGDITSTDNVMTIYFKSDGLTNFDGLDLTVMVFNPNADYNVTINTAEGGSVTANPTSAKVNETVTLTATPDNTYVLSGISVTDASSNPVAVTGGKWYDNTATFTMPGSVATVTPTFSDNLTAAGGLYINMPVTGDQIVEIPAGVESFKVYDDGGKDNVHSQNCTGTLVLTAPENHLLRLSGKITTDPYDYLTVYDGSKENGSKLLNEVRSTSSGTETGIEPVTSKGNVMTIYFYTNSFYEEAGLDLTVTVVNPNTEYNVNVINPAEGGSVTASPTSAKVNETVTLTATPASGYLLSGISVTDAGSNPVAVTWDGPLDNTVTFTMPGSNVTITPTFTNTLTAAGGLYINMPATDSKTITIPSGVQSFKVYDDGGSSSDYSTSCNGTLVLTAPTGYVLQLSGGITAEGSDKLTVYNGSTTNSTKLIDAMGGIGSTKKDIEPVTSTDNVMMINFKSDFSMNYAGLDLTVTLIKQTKDIANCAVTVPDQVVSPYGYSFNDIGSKFDYANNNVGQDYAVACIEDIGAVVMDGSKTLLFGTDYVFGTVAGKTGNEASQVGDEYTVQIVGQGDYAGTKTASFKIKNPGGAWGDLTWSLASGTLTISGDGTMNTATTYNGYGFPWVNYRSQINSVVIGDGVTSIADKAFGETHNQEKYENVTAITLPSTLTSIGANAFNGCTNSSLNITIPTRVTSVGEGAFNTQAKVTATLSESIDNTSLLAALKGVTTDLTFKRTFDANTGGEGKASTVCLPFDLDKPDASVGKFYTFGGVSSEFVVTMDEVSGDKLSAGTPYLFKPAGGAEVAFQNDAYTVPSGGIQAATHTTVGDWTFAGTYTKRTWTSGQTLLYGFTAADYKESGQTIDATQVGSFKRYDSGYCDAFRCYLWASSSLPTTARSVNGSSNVLPDTLKVVLVSASGETTGIGTLDAKTGEVTFGDEWFSLDGQKLDGKPTKKGIYINNGRKVVVQ